MLYRIIDKVEEELKVKLSGVQKILLTTDGSITRILEVLNGEEIVIKTLKRELSKDTIYREVLLLGKESGKIYVFAKSWIPLLKFDFMMDILTKDEPIGKILERNNLEVRREIREIGWFKDEELKKLFKAKGNLFLFRRYHIIHKGEVLIKIEEVFPLFKRST
ncbi:Chorismate pyruvate-lyase [archaeon HR06]|nr:Chorismate pyruvate-lyase [archaeon HR06]